MRVLASFRRFCGVSVVMAGVVLALPPGRLLGQTPVKPKPKSRTATRPGMAAWTPEVQKTLGVSQENFNAVGLNRLSQAQLTALLIAAKPDPNRHVLICPASGTVPAGRIRVFLTVSGDDSTGQIAGSIRSAVSSLNGVDVVDNQDQADRVLNIVIQEQTINQRTIGFTASYLTGTPCIEDVAGKKTDQELKGTLGTYTDPKGPDLARDLAKMLDHDLQPLRAGSGAQ